VRLAAPKDPVAAFAREALRRRLVSREQAEECVAAARSLGRQGKKVAAADLFLRKGYLSKADARAVAAAVKPAAPRLDLAVEEPADECPSCRRDPGVDADCRHCGADLATGGPGPNAIVCGACGQVMRVGAALCPRCASPVARPSSRGGLDVGLLVARVALLAALAGVGYFLVWRPLHAEVVAPPAGDEEGPPAVRALALLERGEPDEAVRLLEREAEGEQGLAARRALAFAARAAGRPDTARAAARAALDEAEDADLRVLLALLALDAGRADEARRELARVPAARRDDAWQRVDARRRASAGEDPVPALEAVKTRTPADTLALALALGDRALARAAAPDTATAAVTDLERARTLVDAPQVRLRCALALAALDRHADALRDLDAALRATPADPSLHLARALSLEATGDDAAAAISYREFLRVAGADPAHAARVRRVRALLGE
jgi:tetratricopeptide (TPR) repeat protein